MVGKTLIELALPKKFGVMVVGIRRNAKGKVIQPSPSEPLKADDNLIIVSNEAAIPKLIKGV
jgi:trk system potassium uptake protein TrkA